MQNNIQPLKQPLDYPKQIEHLRLKHSLVIEDEADAIEILSKVNYYRLSAYGIGLRENNNPEKFLPGISLNHIYRIYQFDEQFRRILSSGIEPIEIELRTKIAHHIALNYGAEGYVDSKNFIVKTNRFNQNLHQVFIKKFRDEVRRQSSLPSVKHHNKKYGGHFPIWVAVELFSFGMLSTLYSLMLAKDQKAVAEQFNTFDKALKSWILSLVEVRNRCAHYGRIYNMPLQQTPFLYRNHVKYRSNKIFPVFLVLRRLMKQDEWAILKQQLSVLFSKYPEVQLSFIGFPNNWEIIL